MPHVESSMMTAVRYDAALRELEVTFATGRVYVYGAVPAEIYAALLAAPSKGEYFNAAIRDAFPTRRTR